MDKIKNLSVILALVISVSTSLYGLNKYMSERAVFKYETKKVITKVETLEKEKNLMNERLARIEAKLDMIIKGMDK